MMSRDMTMMTTRYSLGWHGMVYDLDLVLVLVYVTPAR